MGVKGDEFPLRVQGGALPEFEAEPQKIKIGGNKL
jgi:hypothetical protein